MPEYIRVSFPTNGNSVLLWVQRFVSALRYRLFKEKIRRMPRVQILEAASSAHRHGSTLQDRCCFWLYAYGERFSVCLFPEIILISWCQF